MIATASTVVVRPSQEPPSDDEFCATIAELRAVAAAGAALRGKETSGGCCVDYSDWRDSVERLRQENCATATAATRAKELGHTASRVLEALRAHALEAEVDSRERQLLSLERCCAAERADLCYDEAHLDHLLEDLSTAEGVPSAIRSQVGGGSATNLVAQLVSREEALVAAVNRETTVLTEEIAEVRGHVVKSERDILELRSAFEEACTLLDTNSNCAVDMHSPGRLANLRQALARARCDAEALQAASLEASRRSVGLDGRLEVASGELEAERGFQRLAALRAEATARLAAERQRLEAEAGAAVLDARRTIVAYQEHVATDRPGLMFRTGVPDAVLRPAT